MATQMQIDGGRQIKSATITNAQLAAAAGITDGQLASSYLYANGSRALTGILNGGGFEAQNFVNPTASTSLATKGYVDSLVQGLPSKYTARVATNTETLTIASGSVTTINGTTVDGVTVSVNDAILIMNAPAATGAAGGTTLSSQPANGLYYVTAVATNISVAREPDMSGSNGPFGAQVFVATGTTWGGGGFLVTTPSSTAAFTYGTGNIAFTQFSGAGEITTDITITKSGNQLSRPAITGDVSIPVGSNTSTIGAAAVTYAKMQNVAANSVIGNNTGSAATPVAVPLSNGGAAAASTIPLWDANVNLSANQFFRNLTSTATAAGTTTLTIASSGIQVFTGTTTQTVKLPTTSVPAGAEYVIVNNSTGAVTVQSSGGNTIVILAGGTWGLFTSVVATPTTAANWDYEYLGANVASGKALTVNNSLTLAGTDGTTMTFPGASDTVAGLAATQTLTNKTINASNNTLSNIPLTALAAAAYNTTPTASTLAEWDANKNLSANNLMPGFATTPTAGATTTLTIASAGVQQFTGTTTQTVLLPTTSVPTGATYLIINNSTGNVTVQSSGGNTISTLGAGAFGWFVANVATPTTAANWDPLVPSTGAGTVTAIGVTTANGFAGTSSGGSTPNLTLTTTITGLVKGNGSALSAAVAGTDYMAPSDFVTRETPSGTLNGSNLTFTLANTPIAGTEMVFQNGILLRSGALYDYTISGATITFNTGLAPASTDYLCVTYQK